MRERQRPKPVTDRYLMRSLSAEEMDVLVSLARSGRKGPAAALDALWELILQDAHGLTLMGAADRGFHVQDYAIRVDQAEQLRAAMVERRRLPPKVIAGIWTMWAMYSPADYEPG